MSNEPANLIIRTDTPGVDKIIEAIKPYIVSVRIERDGKWAEWEQPKV